MSLYKKKQKLKTYLVDNNIYSLVNAIKNIMDSENVKELSQKIYPLLFDMNELYEYSIKNVDKKITKSFFISTFKIKELENKKNIKKNNTNIQNLLFILIKKIRFHQEYIREIFKHKSSFSIFDEKLQDIIDNNIPTSVKHYIDNEEIDIEPYVLSVSGIISKNLKKYKK